MVVERIQNDAPKVPQLIMQELINAVEAGSLKAGEELPPERTLAEQLGVGRGSLLAD
ncbi:MAG: GntR family transcriptional regulator, partial [Oscillospiraceae bacterium]|nr:GntR family transcriptional regulator [Oscillospiraceae bacterium]